jgi:hypothetical protein
MLFFEKNVSIFHNEFDSSKDNLSPTYNILALKERTGKLKVQSMWFATIFLRDGVRNDYR